MFSRVLVPVDLDQIDQSRAAIATARLNLATDGQLTLIHVLAQIPAYFAAQIDEGIFESAEVEVRRLLDELKQSENLPDNTIIAIESGVVYRKIIEHIDDPATQAIVMSAHRPRVSDLLLGSVAAQVVRHAPCSVIILRQRSR